MQAVQVCDRCGRGGHDMSACQEPIDLKGPGPNDHWRDQSLWGTLGGAKRLKKEKRWILTTKEPDDLRAALKDAGLPTDDPIFTTFSATQTRNQPTGSSHQGEMSAASNPQATAAPVPTRVRTPAEICMDTLFNACYPRYTQATSQPDQQSVPRNTNLIAGAPSPAQMALQHSALNTIQQRTTEKTNLPTVQQQNYHALRVGFSQSDRRGTVLTNHVIISKLPHQLWKYTTTGDIPNNASPKKKKVLVETMINRMSFLRDNRDHFTYDSSGTFYARSDLHSLALSSPEHHVQLATSNGRCTMATTIPSARSANGADEELRVTLQGSLTADINMSAFTHACHGDSLQIDANVIEIVNALNSIVAKATTNVTDVRYRTFPIGKNKFFLCSGWKPLSIDHGPHTSVLQTNLGFFSTVKPGMGNALLNINAATGAFYQPLTVGEYLKRMEMTANSELNCIEGKGLKGLRVYINYLRGADRGDGNRIETLAINRADRRFRTIFDLGDACNKQIITIDDNSQITICEYQLSKYHRVVANPTLRAVNLGSKARPEWYAPEHLIILPYQPWRGVVPRSLAESMIVEACKTPTQNVAAILERGVHALGLNNAPVGTAPAGILDPLAAFGLTIDSRLMVVPANFLDSPNVNYLDRASSVISWVGRGNLAEGKWAMANKKFNVSASIKRVHFLIPAEFNLGAFESGFKHNLPEYLGGEQPTTTHTRLPAEVIEDSDRDKFMADVRLSARVVPLPDLVVFVNPYTEKGSYNTFRYIMDRELGMPSICIRSSKLKNGRMSAPFFANNAMKMNIRAGANGVNQKVNISDFLPDRTRLADTIIIGADVTHPGSGSSPGTGSMAALVGTVDGHCAIYRGFARPNEPRTEMIQQFSAMLKQLLTAWSAANGGRLPKYVLYFRDGVSDSQYIQVRREEVDKIKEVFKEFRLDAQIPKVTAIVVTKRHHTRFYKNPPVEKRDAKNRVIDDGSTNTIVGTCVDKAVTHFYYNSFFLQSHAAIKGTARPAYYFVLEDDTRMPSAQLQKLVHALCFTYARSACSVSYATPAYYADRLCDRIRILFGRWLSGKEQIPEPVIGQMNAMGVQATRADVGWDRFQQTWSGTGPDGNPWHARLSNKMFWL